MFPMLSQEIAEILATGMNVAFHEGRADALDEIEKRQLTKENQE